MKAIQSDVYQAFRDLGIAEDKALKAAEALSKRDEEVNSLKSDTAVIKWMVGFMLAMQVATLWAVFNLMSHH